MATLAEVVARVADMLARTDAPEDLNGQIKNEVIAAVKHYERQPWAFTETLDATLTTAAGDPWYSTINPAVGESLVTWPAAVAVERVVEIDDMMLDDEALCREDFKTLQTWLNADSTNGEPYHWTRYAGRIGLFPRPDAIYSIKVAARIKPPVPSLDADTSIWFDRAQELIEARAAAQVSAKFLQDMERAQTFAAIAAQQEVELRAESNRESRSGRLKAHY